MTRTLRFFVVGAVAFTLPVLGLLLYSRASSLNMWLAYQAAASNPFDGATVVQIERLNCDPIKKEGAIHTMRTKVLGPGGERSEVIRHTTGEVDRIILTPGGSMIHAYDHLRRKITRKSAVRAEARRLAMLDPRSGCQRTYGGSPSAPGELRHTGEEVIAGYTTVKSVYETADRRLTVWRAPALGCFELQAFLEFKVKSDPSKTASSTLVSSQSVKVGVSPGAFDVPSDFAESKPSEVALDNIRFQLRRSGKTDAEADELAKLAVAKQAKALTADDARYLAQRP